MTTPNPPEYIPWWKEMTTRDLRYCLRRGYLRCLRDVLISLTMIIGLVTAIVLHLTGFWPVALCWIAAAALALLIVGEVLNMKWATENIRQELKRREEVQA